MLREFAEEILEGHKFRVEESSGERFMAEVDCLASPVYLEVSLATGDVRIDVTDYYDGGGYGSATGLYTTREHSVSLAAPEAAELSRKWLKEAVELENVRVRLFLRKAKPAEPLSDDEYEEALGEQLAEEDRYDAFLLVSEESPEDD